MNWRRRFHWCSLSTLAVSWLSCLSMLSEAQAIPGGADQTRPGVRLEKPVHVLIVDDTPSRCTFRSIQQAVAAASDGDVILVRPGSYAPFVINGKSLCVIGEPIHGRLPRARFQVVNLSADQAVIVRGLSGTQPQFGARIGHRVHGNAGPIWVEDCTWAPSSSSISCLQSTVGFFRTENVEDRSSEAGADGLFAESSTIFAYHSAFSGKRGPPGWVDWSCCSSCLEYPVGCPCDHESGGSGGAGIHVSRGPAFLVGCFLQGGMGGDGMLVDCLLGGSGVRGGCGGPGLFLEDFQDSVLFDSQIEAGFSYEYCGQLVETIGGTLTQLRGRTGEFHVGSPKKAGEPIRFNFKGPPGWKAFVTYSSEYTPTFDPRSKGMSVVPLYSPTMFVGTIPSSGELIVTRSYGNLVEPHSEARVIYLQAKFYNPDNCTAVLGTPSVLVVYENCP